MPRKKTTPKAADGKRKFRRNKLATAPLLEPTTVNGIADQDAAEALSPAVTPKQAKKLAKKAKAEKVKPKKPGKVVHPKAKMTFRRNVLPPILGILMTVGVLGLLNGQWLVAQYQYRFMKPPTAASFSAAPATTDPNAQAHIYIPKINVSAPIITDVKSYDNGPVHTALERGVVQYGSASADPGEKGNLVIVGHSSGQLWAPGSYKFVFTLLDKLVNDDRILIDFKGKRYIYRVSGSKVIVPTDLSVLQASDQPELTLITCTPVGTSKNRLAVTARQVSPKPETAKAMDPAKLKSTSGFTLTN